MSYFSKRHGKAGLFWIGMVFLLLSLFVSPAFSLAEQEPMRGTFSGVGAGFSGNATHLGRFDGVIDNTTVTPNAVWIAANGDTLTNITTSFVIDFSAPVAPNVYPYTQTIEFTGGTNHSIIDDRVRIICKITNVCPNKPNSFAVSYIWGVV
jgi:hypothetical protein